MKGNIKVIEAEDFYKRITKNIIYDKEINVVTLGVFVRIVSCSKDWNLNIKGLASALGLSDRKTRECIVLLEKKGYLKRVAVKNENNKFIGWDYEIYNIPIEEELRSRAGKPMDFALLDKSNNGQVLNCEEHNNKPYSNEKPKENKKPKIKYNDFVFMTEEEYGKLVAELGESGAKECIDILNNYKGSKGKTYKSDYLAIRSWVIDKYKEKKAKALSLQFRQSPLPQNNSLPKWKAMGFSSQEEYLKAFGK